MPDRGSTLADRMDGDYTPPILTEPKGGPIPGQQVKAAAGEPDYAAIDAAHQQAVADLTQQWEEQSPLLVEAVAAATAAEITAGTLVGLGLLVVPPAVVAALASGVSTMLLPVAQTAATLAAAELAAAGITAPAGVSAEQQATVGQVAEATAGLITAGYTSGAGRLAVGLTGANLTPEQIVEQVRAHLADLSTAKESGLVAGNMAAAVTTAIAAGRRAVLERAPAGTRFRATEALDRNTCSPCRQVEGTEYDTLTDALADYPTAVRYRACEGRDRCRGLIYAITRKG
jgi:hypothetical protein